MVKVIFHHVCMDGTAALYAAYLKFGDSAEYIGMQCQQPGPKERGLY